MDNELDEFIASATAKTKKHFPQFLDFIDTQNELIRSGACLLTGDSHKEDYEQFQTLVNHVEDLWDAACVLFKSERFPHALFLALAALEETGKIGVTRFQMVLRQVAREAGHQVKTTDEVKRRGNPFFSHTRKDLLAAGAGAIVNNRLDRILGRGRVIQFLEDVQSGDVEHLRQSALYADLGPEGPIIPKDVISGEKARFYVILAGELMAEVLGFVPDEWERLLQKIQAFEEEIGHPSK